MSLSIEDGSGKQDADSYISVADANEYINKWHNSALVWSSTGNTNTERALRVGTRYVDSFEFLGLRAWTSQKLSWPRAGLGPIDGQYFKSSQIPDAIKHAVVEAALKHVDGETLFPDHQGQAIAAESRQVGPISTSIQYKTPKQRKKEFENIKALLKPFLRYGAHSGLARAIG